MATKKQTEAEKLAEQERLIQVLKFTPRTYKIQMWGYGGEYVMGTVDRKIYNYFKSRRLSIEEFAWSEDYAIENNIPEDMYPFWPGSWYDCDNMAHCHGVDRNCGTIQIFDEQDQLVFERSLESINGCDDDEPQLITGDEVWIDAKPAGTVVFIGVSNEKGTFFEGEIALKEPFDITKLTLGYDDVDGNEIVNHVEYNDEEIENWGGSTDGKSSDFGMYVAGSLKDGKWEKYKTMDDIEYTMTPWFPAKIKPVRNGVYTIRTPGKNGYTHPAEWNGTFWHSTYDATNEIKIKEWQGIAYNPDEQDLRDELDQIVLEAPKAIVVPEHVHCTECKWTGKPDETKSKPWPGGMICPECSADVEFTE